MAHRESKAPLFQAPPRKTRPFPDAGPVGLVVVGWAEAPPSDFPNYAAGTWGPEEAQGLLAQGQSWPLPTELVDPVKTKPKAKHQK